MLAMDHNLSSASLTWRNPEYVALWLIVALCTLVGRALYFRLYRQLELHFFFRSAMQQAPGPVGP